MTGVFLFEFSCESDAKDYFGCHCKLALQTLQRWDCHTAIARYPGSEDISIPLETLRAMVEFKPIASLFFADTSLPATILLSAAKKIEEEDSRWGVVRLSDARQIIMSSGMSGVLLSGVAIDETTQWRRENFWHLQDLSDFNQFWRQGLSMDGSNEIQYRYRIHKPRSNDPWEWYRSSYRLIKGEDNLLYQVATFRDRG